MQFIKTINYEWQKKAAVLSKRARNGLNNKNTDEDFSIPDTDTRWFTHDIYDLKEMRLKIINPPDAEK